MPDLEALSGSLPGGLTGAAGPLAAPPTAAPAAPDPYADEAAILALVTRKMQEWSRGRLAHMHTAWRNILFYRGHQWIHFDRVLNRWRPSVLKRNTPRPVTNKFASTMDAMISVIARIEPRLNFRPATDDPDDRATADVAARVIEVVEDEVDLRVHRQHLATWNGLTGGAWIETGYDSDPAHGTRLIQHQECLACGLTGAPAEACPGCGGKLLIPAVSETGEPVGESVPIGKLYVDVVPLFEMYFDPAVVEWTKQRAYCRQKSLSLDEAKARWPALADRILPDTMGGPAELYGEQVQTLAGAVEETGGSRALGLSTGAGTIQNNRVTERWFWSLPTEDYPDGLLAILLSKSLVAYAGPLPYSVDGANGKQPFLPHVFFPQKIVPGSAWPKTVADDLAMKSVQRNQLESLIQMILMRTANPVWLVPEGTNVTNLTGEPGQIIRWNPLGPSPRGPERVPGQGIPAGLMVFLESVDRDFEELAATFDVIKGSRPEGVSAGIALQVLQERALSRFGPMFILWEQAWAQWARQAVEIFRQFATEDRLRKIKGKNGLWQIQKFTGADLQGRIDVVPEAQSSLPQSTLVKRAETEQLVALGVLNPQDPDVKLKILENYGRTGDLPAMRDDTRNAIKENEAFTALGQHPLVQVIGPQVQQMLALYQQSQQTEQPVSYAQLIAEIAKFGLLVPEVRAAVDDHDIHSSEHRTHAKSEEGTALHPLVRALHEAHIAEHDRLRSLAAQAGQPGPKVNVSLKGLLSPQTSEAMAGGGGGAPGPQPGGSGLLHAPAIQVSAMNAGSSGRRMQGDFDEMERSVAAGGG